MKQPFVGPANIAWFKLAEFVARGEKERTLGMYRLSTHSFEDFALVKQLEGDLLLTFKDDAGYEAYESAATAHGVTGRLDQAIFLYEQLVELLPHVSRYYERLVDLYQRAQEYDRMVLFGCRYAQTLADSGQSEKARALVRNLYDIVLKVQLRAHIACVALLKALRRFKGVTPEALQDWIITRAYQVAEQSSDELALFLGLVQEADAHLYTILKAELRSLSF